MLGKITKYYYKGGHLHIEFENGSGYIDFIKDDVFHIYEALGPFSKHPKISYLGTPEILTKGGVLEVRTKSYDIYVGRDFLVKIGNRRDILFHQVVPYPSLENHEDYSLMEREGHKRTEDGGKKPVAMAHILESHDHVYGLGERLGFFDRRGYQYENWNTDDPSAHNESYRALYKSIPFYIIFNTKYSYGIFFDNTFHSYFDLAKTNPDVLKLEADGGSLNYYFIGGSLKEIVSSYTEITGRTPMPQRFMLGYQQSRWSYGSKDEVLALAESFRKWHIPCDVIHLDIDYMDHYKVFTTSREKFGNFKEFIDLLHERGFKVVTIIDPGTKVEAGYETYEELIKNKMVATLNKKPYVNEVWPGDSVYPAFNSESVRKFWGHEIKKLTDMGVDGIWCDMNEPASFKGPLPLDVDFNGVSHKEIHNLYGHFMAMATYQGLKENTGKRPFVITRAAFAGTGAYSTIWTGDNQSLWHHLRGNLIQIASLGLCGFPFAGSDVGGFGADATPELLLRWVEAACIFPLFRNHSAMGTRRQEPWTFDEITTGIYRKYVELRYTLIPYMYDLFYEETKTGLPLVRPLLMEFPEDVLLHTLNDEVMLGPSLLSAPVVDQGVRRRMVYLPKGIWYDFFTDEKYEEGFHVVKALKEDLPLFVREGAIIPLDVVRSHVENPSEMTFKVYPGEGTYLHYQDDGESFSYLNNEYNLYEITHKDSDVKIRILYKGYKEYEHVYVLYDGVRKEVKVSE